MLKPYRAIGERHTVQLWTTGVASARSSARTAQETEAAGWDGMLVVDLQNLSGDPYVSLALAATTTTRIGLGTGVTNSVTRHAAATATAITSVNRISNGRAVLGIGRGDSALAHLGRAPARLAQFERYLRQLQTYLRGEAVSFDEVDIPYDVAPPLSGLHRTVAMLPSNSPTIDAKRTAPLPFLRLAAVNRTEKNLFCAKRTLRVGDILVLKLCSRHAGVSPVDSMVPFFGDRPIRGTRRY